MSGTSMAAAHVTGVVSLLLEAFPDAQPTALSDNIIQNAYHNVLSDVQKPSPNVLLRTLDANIHK
jgi:subtilisin family serine protease